MRIKLSFKEPGSESTQQYLISIASNLRSIRDLKEHISSKLEIERGRTFKLVIAGAELLENDTIRDVVKEDEVVEVILQESAKRRSEVDPADLAREVVESDEREVDHAFMKNLEDIVLLRNHYQTLKRRQGTLTDALSIIAPPQLAPATAQNNKPQNATPPQRSLVKFTNESDDEKTPAKKPPQKKSILKNKDATGTTKQAEKPSVLHKEQKGTKATGSPNNTAITKQSNPQKTNNSRQIALLNDSSNDDTEIESGPETLSKQTHSKQITTITKKGDAEEKKILIKKANVQKKTNSNQDFVEKKSHYNQMATVQKKPGQQPEKKLVQQKYEQTTMHKQEPRRNETLSLPTSTKRKGYAPSLALPINDMGDMDDSISSDIKDNDLMDEGSEPKGNAEIKKSPASGNLPKPQSAEKKPNRPASTAATNKSVEGKFSLVNYIQIPSAVVMDMNKKGKDPLFKVGDIINYKCEELDTRTMSPTVSDFKIARVMGINGDKVQLKILASRSALTKKDQQMEEEEEEEEDKEPELYFHNFAELHIAKHCLNIERMTAIKQALTEFKTQKIGQVNAQNAQTNTKTPQPTTNTDTHQAQNGKPVVPSSETMTLENRAAKQVDYYFSDKNYKNDNFLKSFESKSPNRFFPLNVMLKFPRLRQMGIVEENRLQQILKGYVKEEQDCTYELDETETMIRKRRPDAAAVNGVSSDAKASKESEVVQMGAGPGSTAEQTPSDKSSQDPSVNITSESQ